MSALMHSSMQQQPQQQQQAEAEAEVLLHSIDTKGPATTMVLQPESDTTPCKKEVVVAGPRERVAPARISALGHVSREGMSEHLNEDRYVVHQGLNFHVLAVLDGHGGAMAANYIETALVPALSAVFERGQGFADTGALVGMMAEMEAALLKKARRLRDDSGACVLVVLVYWDADRQSHQLMTLNVGDCRAIVMEHATVREEDHQPHANDDSNQDQHQHQNRRRSMKATKAPLVAALSQDHCASNRSEVQRVTAAGGYIRNGRIAGVLEPFRSLGDLDLKGAGMKGWVVATPEISTRELAVGRTTLLLATDGVWSELANQRVMAVVQEELTDGGDAQSAAEAVVEEAREEGSEDDITVIVVVM